MHIQIVYAALMATASAHGVVRTIEGANGVSMPGLSIADGTPRNCAQNACGSQADTSIIRDSDLGGGKGGALGKTQGNGAVDPAKIISTFMGASAKGSAPTNDGASGAVGQEDDISGLQTRREEHKRQFGIGSGFFGNLVGGGDKAKGAGADAGAGAGAGALGGLLGGLGGGLGGALGGGGAGKKTSFAKETIVSDTAGEGASKGLPTSDDKGVVSMVFRQINQDGAGPMSAAIDPSSGGYDASAFQTAKMVQDVPGIVGGLSVATNTDFPIKVQMPDGMVCSGKVGGADNVCIVRVRNQALAGPFGGSAAFTQSNAARKRAIAYRLKKRYEF